MFLSGNNKSKYMQLEIYHWLAPLISIFYIIRTVKQYSLGKYSPRNTIIWITFWIGVALLGIMPNEIATSLSKGLGFRDAPNAIIFVALGLLFLMNFYLSAALNRVENQLTDLVRQLAIMEVQQNTSEKIITPISESTSNITSEDHSANMLKDIEELENIVNQFIPGTTDENPTSIPSEGKNHKSSPKE